jgi:hypothetical protein
MLKKFLKGKRRMKMNNNQERVKQLIGEENYNLLLRSGYFPIEIDSFKKIIGTKFENNQNQKNDHVVYFIQ